MAFQTGLFWLHNTTGIVGVDDDYYTALGRTVTATEVSADIAANRTVVIDTGGASACYVKPLLNTTSPASGSGANTATMDIWGGMGFGEPTQDNFQTGPKILYRLVSFQNKLLCWTPKQHQRHLCLPPLVERLLVRIQVAAPELISATISSAKPTQ